MIKTTDDQNEVFDIVDEHDNVIGKATRGEAHANKNLIHRSIGVVVFNKKGEVFLQQRSATKDTDPLKWTISASGHVESKIKDQRSKIKNKDQKAKIYENAARRELVEELGVDLDIEPICKYICSAPFETEMQMLFKGYSDGPFKLHPEEIIQGKFFTQKELNEAIKREEIELSFSGKVSLEKVGFIF